MKRSDLLPDMEVQFTEPEDVALYGDQWFTYSELDLATLPARRQIELEQLLDSPLAAVMDGVRQSSTFGDLAGAWLAIHLAGDPTPWEKFNPKIFLAEWRVKPQGKAPEVPPASVADAGPTPEHATTPPDTVLLPTLPIME